MNQSLPQETKSKKNTKNLQLLKFNSRDMNKIVYKHYLMLLSKNKQINFRKNRYLQEEIYLRMTVRLRFNLQRER